MISYLALFQQLVIVEFLGKCQHLGEVFLRQRWVSHEVLSQLLHTLLWILRVVRLHPGHVLHRL